MQINRRGSCRKITQLNEEILKPDIKYIYVPFLLGPVVFQNRISRKLFEKLGTRDPYLTICMSGNFFKCSRITFFLLSLVEKLIVAYILVSTLMISISSAFLFKNHHETKFSQQFEKLPDRILLWKTSRVFFPRIRKNIHPWPSD